MRRHHSLVAVWVRSVLCLTAVASVPLLLVAVAFGVAVPYSMVVGVCLLAGHSLSIAFGKPGITQDLLQRWLSH